MFRAATLHKTAVSRNEVKLIFFCDEVHFVTILSKWIIFLSFLVDEWSSFVAQEAFLFFAEHIFGIYDILQEKKKRGVQNAGWAWKYGIYLSWMDMLGEYCSHNSGDTTC
jgi:hypothetical protein